MRIISLEEFEKLSKRRHTVVMEGKEHVLEDGRKVTPVRIRTKGFRPMEALVHVPNDTETNEEKAPVPEGRDKAVA